MIKTMQFAIVAFVLLQCTDVYSQAASDSQGNGVAEAIADSNASAIKTITLGETKNPHRLDSLFFSGQFPKKDLDKLKQEKIERVITLRTDGEIEWDEKSAVEAVGLEFIEIPFRNPEALTDEVFDLVRKTLAESDKPTLVHCGSANRVGGVWLPYRVLDQGVDLETALAEAKVIGLRTPFIQEKAIDYIKRQQATSKINGEASVKPGVNDSFTDPDLDVDAFVKRFEIESREVYLTREKILAACDIEKGDTVADIGAGTGLFTRLFATSVDDEGWIYAVDIAPRFIEHINQAAAQNNLNNITGVLGAENSVNLPPDSVDVVFICDTYHHFEYPKSTLASIHRALKDDGHMIVIDFERIEGQSRDWTMGHVRGGKEVFRAEILDAGFTLVEEKAIDGFEENYFLKFRKD